MDVVIDLYLVLEIIFFKFIFDMNIYYSKKSLRI